MCNFYNGRRKLIKYFNLVLNISIMQQYWNIFQINFKKISQIMRDTFKTRKLIIFEWFIYPPLFIRTNWLQPSFIFLNVKSFFYYYYYFYPIQTYIHTDIQFPKSNSCSERRLKNKYLIRNLLPRAGEAKQIPML